MQNIPGTRIATLPFSDAKHVRDLLYFDGPFISEFRSSTGMIYIYVWCDKDDRANRWFVFETSDLLVARVESQSITLREFIESSVCDRMSYFIDNDGDGHSLATSMCTAGQIPGAYLPKPGALLVP